jgi:hypothetical protein
VTSYRRQETPGVDRDNLVWTATGLETEKSRCWRLISASIISRAGSEAISLSN